jgi:hypothetical protein
VAVWTAAFSLYRNQSWDDNLDLFGLKIASDLARAFWMQIALTVLPPDFANSCGQSNNKVGGFFVLLVIFLSLTALMTRSCPLMHCKPTYLFLPTFSSPGERGYENACLHHSSDLMGLWYIKWFDRLCWRNG